MSNPAEEAPYPGSPGYTATGAPGSWEMAELVRYALDDGIATLTLDDGKRNALSPEMLTAIGRALDRAESDGAMVILTGREDVFSAGFDLKVMGRGGLRALRMLAAGFALPARLLGHPTPVICACNGHTVAMGVFVMLAADSVVAAEGDYKVQANEVAIGLPLPRAAEVMLRHRLRPADFQRAAVLAENFPPEAALAAGFLDELVPAGALMERAREKARELADLDPRAHRITKRRLRRRLRWRIRWSIPLDLLDAVLLGIRRARS